MKGFDIEYILLWNTNSYRFTIFSGITPFEIQPVGTAPEYQFSFADSNPLLLILGL